MRILYKGVGEAPNRVEIPNSLRALQASVGGRIETHTFSTSAAVICNAEGTVNGMPYNCTFLGQDWYGPVMIVGVKDEEFCSLPEQSFFFLEKMVGRK